MGMYLLLAFLIVPVIEIAVFIEVGGLIGLWPTVALIVLTAVLGMWMLRIQGFGVLRRAQESIARNEPPVREVFDGFCLALAGVLLIVPGFVSDTLGLLLFIPAFRNLLRRRLMRQLSSRGGVRVFVDGGEVRPGQGPRPPGRGSGIIEGEFREVDPNPSGPGSPGADLPPPDSRWRPGPGPGSREER
jgi:UPF0716 protein FxsA